MEGGQKLLSGIREEIIGGRVIRFDPRLNEPIHAPCLDAQLERAKEFFRIHGEPDFRAMFPELFPKNDK